jgi:hypothetical protein
MSNPISIITGKNPITGADHSVKFNGLVTRNVALEWARANDLPVVIRSDYYSAQNEFPYERQEISR